MGSFGLLGLWIGSLMTLFVIASGSMKYFNEQAQVTETYPLGNRDADTLVLKALDDDAKGIATQLGLIKLSKERFVSYDVKLNISKSESNSFELQKTKESRGISLAEARELSGDLNYMISQTDEELAFNKYFSLKPNTKWRNQKVRLELKVPKGKTVLIDKSLEAILQNISTIHGSGNRQLGGHTWTMLEDGLSCLDCETSASDEESLSKNFESTEKSFDYTDFHSVNIQGSILVDVQKRQEHGLLLEGSQNDIESIQLEVKDEKIYIKSKLGKRGKLLKLTLRMPELHSFKASDAGDIYINDFDNDLIDIELVGSNELKASVEAKTLSLLVNGSSEVELNGRAETLVVELNGTSELDADQFPVKNARIISLGSTQAELYVTDTLYHKTNISSQLEVGKGNPKKIEIDE